MTTPELSSPLASLGRWPLRPAPPSTSWPPPKTWPRSRARWAATRSRSTSIARGYQDPHFVEAKPSFILKLAQGRPAGGGRARAGDRLAAAAHPAEPQREDPARRRGLPRRLADREDPRDPDRPGHARDGRRASAGQPALLARSRQRAPHRQGDPGEALARWSPRTPPTSRSATPTSTSVWPRPRSAGTRRWRPTRACKIVTYHRSWPNFADRFGLDVVGYVEPKPGIPPSPEPHARADRTR